MFKVEQIETMCKMQNALNSSVHPEWTKQGWDWNTAIKMETAELVECFQWKHWKDVNTKIPDLDNAKVEWLDVLHFLLSGDIEYWIEDGLTLDDAIITITDDYNTCLENYTSKDEILSTLEHAKQFLKLDYSVCGIEKTMGTFFNIMYSLGMTTEDAFKGYVTKNVLNQFRQENGYKEGTYQKMWNLDGVEVEDNVVAFKIADTLDADANLPTKLKESLLVHYSNL